MEQILKYLHAHSNTDVSCTFLAIQCSFVLSLCPHTHTYTQTHYFSSLHALCVCEWVSVEIHSLADLLNASHLPTITCVCLARSFWRFVIHTTFSLSILRTVFVFTLLCMRLALHLPHTQTHTYILSRSPRFDIYTGVIRTWFGSLLLCHSHSPQFRIKRFDGCVSWRSDKKPNQRNKYECYLLLLSYRSGLYWCAISFGKIVLLPLWIQFDLNPNESNFRLRRKTKQQKKNRDVEVYESSLRMRIHCTHHHCHTSGLQIVQRNVWDIVLCAANTMSVSWN